MDITTSRGETINESLADSFIPSGISKLDFKVSTMSDSSGNSSDSDEKPRILELPAVKKIWPKESRKEHHAALTKGLNAFRKDDTFTDFTILCCGTKVRVHRLVLAISSSYFRSMFECNMKEVVSSQIELHDVSLEVLEIILEFLYTGCFVGIRDEFELLESVLRAAHFMDIQALYDYCWDKLGRCLSLDNFVRFWDLADFFNNVEMRKNIRILIALNYYICSKSPEFLNLNENQFKLILSLPHVTYNTLPDNIMKGIVEWVKHDVSERQKNFTILWRKVNLNSLTADYVHTLRQESVVKNSKQLMSKLCLRGSGASTSSASLPFAASSSTDNHIAFFRRANEDADYFEESEDGPECYCVLFDVQKQLWSEVKTMPFNFVEGATTVSHGNVIYFIGGSKGKISASRTVKQYNPFTNTVSPCQDMKMSRSFAGAAVLEDVIYVVGGKDEHHDDLSSVERYYLRGDKWDVVCSTVLPVGQCIAAGLHNHLYVSEVECVFIQSYNPTLNKWREITSYLFSEHVPEFPRLFPFRDQIYVAPADKGGRACVYNPVMKRWKTVKMAKWPSVFKAWSVKNQEGLLFVLDDKKALHQFDNFRNEWKLLTEPMKMKWKWPLSVLVEQSA